MLVPLGQPTYTLPVCSMKEPKTSTRQTLGYLKRLVMMFMKSGASGKAKALAVFLGILMLCINGMNVVNSYVGRDFMSAIANRDEAGFIYFAWIYAAVFAGSTVVAVLFHYCEERIGLLWRDFMTHRMVELYVDKRIFLHMEESGTVTNPDQRIAEDVKSLTVSTLSFILMILNGTVTAVSFSSVLWTISPMLFVCSVVYAGVGSLFTILLGRPLIRLNYQQLDREADFRSELIRLREHAEGVALMGNEGRIRDRLLERLDQLVANYRHIISVNRNLNYFSTGYNYMIQLIPALFIAPLFIHGKVEFGVIGQAAMAFSTLLGAFSLIVSQFQSISTYASVIARLGELVEATDDAKVKDEQSCIGCSANSDLFGYVNLTLCALHDKDKILIQDLTGNIEPGMRLLVTGTNEGAKQGLFRASAGLYDAGTGSILRPPVDKMAFLPERPYLPASTLRELLVPKERDAEVTDADIKAVVKEVGLGPAIAKHDGIEQARNWQERLSFVEQQMAAVARVILAKPDFAFLDHLDSALPEPLHHHILKLLASHQITCVSIGDGPADPDFHDYELKLNDDASWEWKAAPKSEGAHAGAETQSAPDNAEAAVQEAVQSETNAQQNKQPVAS